MMAIQMYACPGSNNEFEILHDTLKRFHGNCSDFNLSIVFGHVVYPLILRWPQKKKSYREKSGDIWGQRMSPIREMTWLPKGCWN